MPWYLEHDFKPFGRGKVERRLIELDLPDNISSQAKARQKAAKTSNTLELINPLLVWKEKVPG